MWMRRDHVVDMPDSQRIAEICVSQLFAEEEMVELTPELKELFDYWIALAPEQKKAALAMLKAMNHDSL